MTDKPKNAYQEKADRLKVAGIHQEKVDTLSSLTDYLKQYNGFDSTLANEVDSKAAELQDNAHMIAYAHMSLKASGFNVIFHYIPNSGHVTNISVYGETSIPEAGRDAVIAQEVAKRTHLQVRSPDFKDKRMPGAYFNAPSEKHAFAKELKKSIEQVISAEKDYRTLIDYSDPVKLVDEYYLAREIHDG